MSSAPQSVFGQTRAPDDIWLSRAAAEAPIDPDIPIVDPHVHLWHHRTGYKYFVEEYAKDIKTSGHNVVASVFVECHAMYRASGPEHLRCIGETEFAVGMSAIGASGLYTPSRVATGIVGFADLTLGSRTRETLEAHIEAGGRRFKGVRQRAKWDADPAVRGAVCADRPGLYLESSFDAGLDFLSSLGLVFEASIYHPQLPDVVALARKHPDASIVLVHTGSPVGHGAYSGRSAEVHATWMAGMRALAEFPNVSVKLGGLLMCLGSFDFTSEPSPPTSAQLANLWRPFIEPCIELFGVQRCMVSSNFPVDRAGFGYGTVWNMFKRITANCSPEERRWLCSETANRVYGLTPP